MLISQLFCKSVNRHWRRKRGEKGTSVSRIVTATVGKDPGKGTHNIPIKWLHIYQNSLWPRPQLKHHILSCLERHKFDHFTSNGPKYLTVILKVSFIGHRSFIKNTTQTAVMNMVRPLVQIEKNVTFTYFSCAKQDTFSKVSVTACDNHLHKIIIAKIVLLNIFSWPPNDFI